MTLSADAANRNRHLHYRYRLTSDLYDQLLAQQGGVCGICGKPPMNRRLAVDHDRRCCTGRRACEDCIRGLLCMSCNTSLGWLEAYAEDALGWQDRRALEWI